MRDLRRTSIHRNGWYWDVIGVLKRWWQKLKSKIKRTYRVFIFFSEQEAARLLQQLLQLRLRLHLVALWFHLSLSLLFLTVESHFITETITNISWRDSWILFSFIRRRHRPGLPLREVEQALCCDARVQAESRARTDDNAGQGYTRTRRAGPRCLRDIPTISATTIVFRSSTGSTPNLITVSIARTELAIFTNI